MSAAGAIKEEVAMGLRLLAFQAAEVEVAPMALVDAAMAENQWNAVSGAARDGNAYVRFYYNTAMKQYARATCDGYTGACRIQAEEEADVLEGLNFEELKVLGNLIDKKSVAFIRIYSEKELASAKTEEELQALNARNDRMIQEAEEALRKR